MNFFKALAFVFSTSEKAERFRRVWEARKVTRDAWIEAGGCSECSKSCKRKHVVGIGSDPMPATVSRVASPDFASLATTLRPPTRVQTGIPGLNATLGGGFVLGSMVALSGSPGVGKSTLALQAADGVTRSTGRSVMYASGEQSVVDMQMFATRLGISEREDIYLRGNDSDVYRIVDECTARGCAMLVVDSLHTAYMDDVASDVGSISQMRAVANYLASFAKETNTIVLLLLHVRRDGEAAGPSDVAHLADTNLRLDRDYDVDDPRARILETGKNRYGREGVVARFEMTATGFLLSNGEVRWLDSMAISVDIEL